MIKNKFQIIQIYLDETNISFFLLEQLYWFLDSTAE